MIVHNFLLTLLTYSASSNLGQSFRYSHHSTAAQRYSTAAQRSSILSSSTNNPGWLTRLALRIASTPFGGWFFTAVAPFIDRFLLKRSNGRYSLAGLGAPTLLLTTTGRASGLARQTPLLYLRHPSVDGHFQLLLIGSRGGRRAHPHWYLNLTKHPFVQVTLDGTTSNYQAIEACGEDWQVLWAMFVRFNPGFERYRARVSRHIPIIVLKPSEPL